jgi:glycolate oxidase FAD binding subunit
VSGLDMVETLCEQVRQACSDATPLNIHGGNSKAFYGRHSDGQPLDMREYIGILSYEPSELVVRARAGTRLQDIEQLLDEQRQILAFEPPHFTENSTLGGAIAAGLSGPRRPFAGAARDFVLGVGLINGKGEHLNFGGQVMKNVAGYDLSRLMTGALGTLGVITDVALKVLPKPDVEYTLKQVCSQPEAIARFSDWSNKPLPISAACWHDDHLFLRLSGSEAAARQAQHRLGDNLLEVEPERWRSLRDHQHAFFRPGRPLWRISLPPATPPLALEGEWLIDWGGAQRWLYTEEDTGHIRKLVSDLGGHATLFRNGDRQADVFQPLPATLFKLHKRLKHALDPAGIFNPGRLYKDL